MIKKQQNYLKRVYGSESFLETYFYNNLRIKLEAYKHYKVTKYAKWNYVYYLAFCQFYTQKNSLNVVSSMKRSSNYS